MGCETFCAEAVERASVMQAQARRIEDLEARLKTSGAYLPVTGVFDLKFLAKHGPRLTLRCLAVLFVLAERGDVVAFTDITRKLGLTRPGGSVLFNALKTLVGMGLVARERVPGSKYAKGVRVTPRGLEFARRIINATPSKSVVYSPNQPAGRPTPALDLTQSG